MKKLLYILLLVPFGLFAQIPPQVGDIGYGGIVFHVDEYVHVVAREKSPYSLQLGEWNQYYGYPVADYSGAQDPEFGINATTNIIDGMIVSLYTNGYTYPSASLYAITYNSDGFNDWFIPNNYEFDLIKDLVLSYPSHFEDVSGYSYWSINRGFGSWQGYKNYACGNCFTDSQFLTVETNNSFTKYIIPVRSFPIVYGCVDELAINYDTTATVNDSSCLYSYDLKIENLEDSIGDLISSVNSVNSVNDSLTTQINSSTIAISSIQEALDTWNTSIDLSNGWNMFGYGCPISIDLAEGLSNHTDKIIIVKDNNGNVYMPEFGFNGIGNLTPGYGYQIKVTEEINNFSLCDWYVNDIPEDNIVSLQEENDSLQAVLDSIYGCIDEAACNYDQAIIDDGSCVYSDLGYDCEGNIAEYVVGMQAEGGIVFYVDETGMHGLVSAIEDLEGTYEWGCYQQSVNSANNSSIGAGYQNTLDISNQGCVTENGGLTAAQATLNYESGDYSDWYLPSKLELDEMYNSISNGGPFGNIGGFSGWYSSSTEVADWGWHAVNLDEGNSAIRYKNEPFPVRPIRSF